MMGWGWIAKKMEVEIDGYGSIPIDTFLVGWTSIYQLFWGSLGTRVLTHPQMNIIPKVGNIVAMAKMVMWTRMYGITRAPRLHWLHSKSNIFITVLITKLAIFSPNPKKHHSRSLFTSKENWQLHATSHVQSYLLLGVQISRNILFQADTCGALVLALFAIDHFGMSVIGDSRSVVILQWFFYLGIAWFHQTLTLV